MPTCTKRLSRVKLKTITPWQLPAIASIQPSRFLVLAPCHSLHRLDCHVRFPVGIMSAITFGSYAVVLLPRNCTCTGLMYVSRGGWDCLVIGLQNHQKGIPMCRGLSIEGTSYATGMTFLVISVSTFAKALGFPPPKSHHTRDPCADQKPSDRHEQSYVGKSCEGWKEDRVSCRHLSS